MRNLKKILALVLALMMVLSVMATASALDFADASDIEKTEAVSVMAGLEILAGKPTADGEFNFDPQGTLKRQEAAKILAYVLTGDYAHINDVAADASAAHPFTDVAKGDWAEAFITYCYNAGLMVGNGNGIFGYNKTLTGYELGKMVLVAIGIEGTYTGLGWQLNVHKTLKANGLLENVTVGGDAITREDAAQLIWNAMNWTATGKVNEYVVWVDANGNEKLDAGEQVVYEGTDKYMAQIALIKDGAIKKEVTTNAGSLADVVFGVTCETKTGKFGHVTRAYKSELIKDMKVEVNVDAQPYVLVADVAGTDALEVINKTLGLKDDDQWVATSVEGKTLTVWVNGVQDGGHEIGVGDTVEVYLDEEGDVLKVIVLHETLTQVVRDDDSVIKTGENKGKYVWSFNYANPANPTETFTVSHIAAYDAYEDMSWHLTYIKADEAKVLETAPVVAENVLASVYTVEGEYEDAVITDYIVIGEKEYPLATGFVDYKKDKDYWYDVEFDVIMNSNGYVVAVTDPDFVDPVELETGYAWLKDAELLITNVDTKGDLINTDGAVSFDIEVKAQLLLPDNTTIVVDLYTWYGYVPALDTYVLLVNGTSPYNADNYAVVPNASMVKPAEMIGDQTKGGTTDYVEFAHESWIKYTIQPDGTYTLAGIYDGTDIGLGYKMTLTKGDANITELGADDVYATSKTEWTLYDYNTKTGVITLTEKTGYKNFPSKKYHSIETINKLNFHLIDAVDSFNVTTPTAKDTTLYAFYLGDGNWFELYGDYARKFAVAGGISNIFFTGIDGDGDGYVTEGDADDLYPLQLPIDDVYAGLAATDKVYTLTVDAKGNYVTANEIDDAHIFTGTVKFVDFGNGYMIMNEEFYKVGGDSTGTIWAKNGEIFLNKDVVIYNVAGDKPTGAEDVVTGKLNDLKLTSHGDEVVFVTNDKDEVVAIFIINNAK